MGSGLVSEKKKKRGVGLSNFGKAKLKRLQILYYIFNIKYNIIIYFISVRFDASKSTIEN